MAATAAGQGADIPQKLAALLGRGVGRIRKTADVPPKISIIDVVSAVTSLNGNNAAMTFARMKDEHPDVTTRCGDVRFH